MLSVKERVDLISDNSNLILKQFPTSAKIEISGKCTLDCNFCYSRIMKEMNFRQKIMTIEDFSKILSFLKGIKTIKEVGLFYIGESAINNKMPIFYKMLKDQGYFTYLTTNGTIAKTVIESIPNIDSLKVSWNYKNKEDFIQKTKKTKKEYYQIIENINQFYIECHRNNKKLTISTILDSNKSDYKTALKMLSYDDHYWIPLQTQCGINNKGIGGVVGESEKVRSQMPCWSLFKGLYIDSELNVRTCCYGHEKYHILYNINQQKEFILDKKILKMRENHLQKIIPNECKKCINNF